MTDEDRRARLDEVREFHAGRGLHLEADGSQICRCGPCEARLLLAELEQVERDLVAAKVRAEAAERQLEIVREEAGNFAESECEDARLATLEEAAKVLDGADNGRGDKYAAAIRALRG